MLHFHCLLPPLYLEASDLTALFTLACRSIFFFSLTHTHLQHAYRHGHTHTLDMFPLFDVVWTNTHTHTRRHTQSYPASSPTKLLNSVITTEEFNRDLNFAVQWLYSSMEIIVEGSKRRRREAWGEGEKKISPTECPGEGWIYCSVHPSWVAAFLYRAPSCWRKLSEWTICISVFVLTCPCICCCN